MSTSHLTPVPLVTHSIFNKPKRNQQDGKQRHFLINCRMLPLSKQNQFSKFPCSPLWRRHFHAIWCYIIYAFHTASRDNSALDDNYLDSTATSLITF